jgi:hypothetical protein
MASHLPLRTFASTVLTTRRRGHEADLEGNDVDGGTGTAGRRPAGGMRRRRVDRDGREPERRGDLAGTVGKSTEPQ